MITRIAPPQIMALSLAEVKTYLRIDHTGEDELLALLIAHATQQFEDETHEYGAVQEIALRVPVKNEGAYGVVEILPFPVASIHGVSLLLKGGQRQDLLSKAWTFEPMQRKLFLRGLRAGSILITLRVGYGESPDDLPPNLKVSLLRLVASLYEERACDIFENPRRLFPKISL